MTERKLRIGVAGAGHFGRYHALKVAASDRATLVGIHDASAERAAQIAAETQSTPCDFATLLAEADAIIVAAPAAAHHELVKKALTAENRSR